MKWFIKKANSLFALISVLSICGHAGSMVYSLLTGWYSYNLCKALAHTTAAAVTIHVGLCLIIYFFIHEGSKISYAGKENAETIIQRITGLLIILLVHRHIVNYQFIMSGEIFPVADRVRLIICELAYFGSIYSHLALSVQRLGVSFGVIKSKKAYLVIEKIIKPLCAALFLLTAFAIVRFVVMWG